MAHRRDADVQLHSTALSGTRVLLGVSGGIAAVESVKVARELRRHAAKVTVVLTHSAQKIISPLALSWASDSEVIADWEADMRQLDEVDAVLVCPTTRHHMASMVQGLMDTPLLMGLSAARGRGIPVMLVPSMHENLAADPVTSELESALTGHGIVLHWGPKDENKSKQDDAVSIVAAFCHMVNTRQPDRRSVVITLGATRSAIDDVRFIQNTSTGKTGWMVGENLHRHGHDVTVVAGATSTTSTFPMPLVIRAEDPDRMLLELKALSNDEIDAWVHCAAVLDYVVDEPLEGKYGSGQGELALTLKQGEKHIEELAKACEGSVRIGFKLEVGIKLKDLINRALAQIHRAGMSAVVANRLEDLNAPDKARAHLVDSSGEHWALVDEAAIATAVLSLVERGSQ